MDRKKNSSLILICTLVLCAAPNLVDAQAAAAALGIFDDHGDVGTVLHPGSAEYDPSTASYTISGSGENMWFGKDAYHFVWKKVSGDISLTADADFITKTGNPHKKAVLMFRQSLDTDSPYVDVAVHLSGMTSLQYRDEKGVNTHEIQSNISAPTRLRLVKRGDYVYLWLGGPEGDLKVSGASIRSPLQGTFYVGIGVCSHDKDVVEKAVFSKVELTTPPAATGEPKLYSTLESVAISSTDRHVAYVAPEHFEAPNWTRDGAAFLFNSNGHIMRLPVPGGEPAIIDTASPTTATTTTAFRRIRNGWLSAISHRKNTAPWFIWCPSRAARPGRSPKIPHPIGMAGRRMDPRSLSSDSEMEISISTPSQSPAATRLVSPPRRDSTMVQNTRRMANIFTSTPSAPASCRSGACSRTAAGQEQITSDEFNNWFPHISPDGKWMVFLTYDKDVTGHPENKDVKLRLMSLEDKKITVLASLFGGQGTINVPSWSPDSKQLAFVSYELIR